jgi:hypothetical protein
MRGMRLRLVLTSLATITLAACGPARIETDPSSLQLFGRGQQANVHATPFSKSGQSLPGEACRWSTSDPKVVTVAGAHNDGKVTAVGHGRALVKCAVGSVAAEVPVTVTLVSRVEVSPPRLELRVLDEPQPAALAIRALDGDGREVAGRVVATRCLDENVCRGDARGQVWPVGAGETKVLVQVDDGAGEAPVRVTDARSAAARPRSVRGNPMEHIADEPGRR